MEQSEQGLQLTEIAKALKPAQAAHFRDLRNLPATNPQAWLDFLGELSNVSDGTSNSRKLACQRVSICRNGLQLEPYNCAESIMTTTSEPSSSYHCAVPPELSAGKLLLSFRDIRINMLSVSADEFSFLVDKRKASKLAKGKQYWLQYRAEDWDVELVDRESFDDYCDVVIVKRLRDKTKLRFRGTGISHLIASTGENADPLIVFTIAFGLAVVLLTLPGWGEELGTSRPIADLMERLYQHIENIIRS